MIRLCPVCAHRNQHLVDPECVICQGAGGLHLAQPALETYPAEVVAEAVVLALEAKARLSDTTLTLSDDRLAGVREAMAMLQDAGILSNADGLSPHLSPAVASKGRTARPAAAVASEVIQEPIAGLDELLTGADPYRYAEHERPGGRGLPVLSRAGHPSHLARLGDPADPQGDTRAAARGRDRTTRQARALVTAGQQAAGVRDRRRMSLETLELAPGENVATGGARQMVAA